MDLGDFLTVGDIVQCDGESVPPELRDKYFIVRKVDPTTGEAALSWPYEDAQAKTLYCPPMVGLSNREREAKLEAVARREAKAEPQTYDGAPLKGH